MPINYKEGIIKEHLHVRNSVGLFDVSHMGQILIPINKPNLDFLLKYIPLNLDKIAMNKCYYSFLINNSGGIIDDIIISKISYNNKFFFHIVYNAGRKKNDEEIFIYNLSNYILLENNSLLAIQGPNSEEVLSFIIESKNLFFMQSQSINFLNHEIILSRTGYTGEDGFEISIPNEIVNEFIIEIMKNTNVKLCGLGSRDSLRLEAGLSLYGNELNEKITPIDANLTWSLSKDRLRDGKLNGSKILINQLKLGVDKLKVGFKAKSKSILRSNMKIYDNVNNIIGFITSGGYSPILNSSIAIGYVDKSKINQEKIFTLIRGRLEELAIKNLPFIKSNYKKGG
tara:strand:+ start:229 stop:1251 length:1023 start_codon:yes stop_codon:yes gene_type:complete